MSAPSSRPTATLASASTHPAAQTPMMRQYLEAKTSHPDAIVLFRMGDFYETFFEDAVDTARICELTLTSRNKKDAEPIPMAGVPHHALPGYVQRLVDAGRKVAICEQMEAPKQAKGIVRREVVRVITPGVILEDAVLDGRRNNYLAALALPDDGGAAALVWVDVSTGERAGAVLCGLGRALDELGRLDAAEVLVCADPEPVAATGRGGPGPPTSQLGELLARRLDGAAISVVSAPAPSATDDAAADLPTGVGGAARAALARGAAMIADYLALTRKGGDLWLGPLELRELESHLGLGPETVRNLELIRTLHDGRRRGSVLGLVDMSRTPMGGRLVKRWLLYPLTDAARIRERHDVVEAFHRDPLARARVREAMDAVADLERLAARTVASVAGPRDLAALAIGLAEVPTLARALEASGHPVLAGLAGRLDAVPEARQAIEAALEDDPPATLKDGGVIREGHHEALDELLGIARDGKRWFAEYAAGLRDETGIASLKIRFNNVFGYFLEVTKANLHLVPDTWLRKQTLANAERYYTPELKAREDKVLGADDRRLALEAELFGALRKQVAGFAARIQATAAEVARLDALAGFAELAATRDYVRPTVDDSGTLRLVEARHPVVETHVPSGEFVPNDLTLDVDGDQLVILTGPNMAGKSTVMRQVALAAVLAQMGCFVPATEAHIGICDRVFTRVGASDNLARGESTFMVEMTETSTILREATKRSLVVLDEIGRGTSTYDGVSIAWAVAEHLHDHIGARTLFATHYHELTELEATRERVVNMTVAVKQWQDDIVFLRRLVPGGTSRSYGIQVGRLAGLPGSVVTRAKAILATLEGTDAAGLSHPRVALDAPAPGQPGRAPASAQLSLFAPAGPGEALAARLRDVDPDALTPRDALALLYELVDEAKGS